jgi:cell division protein FtsI (penicillin-binding protein 3)
VSERTAPPGRPARRPGDPPRSRRDEWGVDPPRRPAPGHTPPRGRTHARRDVAEERAAKQELRDQRRRPVERDDRPDGRRGTGTSAERQRRRSAGPAPVRGRRAHGQPAARAGAAAARRGGAGGRVRGERDDVRSRRGIGKRLERRVKRNDDPARPTVWRAGRPRRRLLAVFAAVAVVFGLVVTRVALLQTADASGLVERGEQQRIRSATLTADRGVVFDRNGVELAISVPSTTIYADPHHITDAKATASALASILKLTPVAEAALASDLADTSKGFVYVARQIDDDLAAAIKRLALPGIGWYDEQQRVAPSGDLARGVVGRTDIDGKGIAGVEKQFDDLLKGVPGKRTIEVDGQGRSIPTGTRVLDEAVPGDDVVLTLSRPLQYAAEQALLKAVPQYSARGGTAIVMDSHTGELLAMAGVRRDDTGKYQVSSSNIGAVDVYEPGSVAKVITIAGALNDGAVKPDTVFSVPGSKHFYDPKHALRDAEAHGQEDMTVAKILAKSSNIGTILVSQAMGDSAKLQAYQKAFGLGAKSALDFPGESAGILIPPDKQRGDEKVTPAYGQGVAATAVQLISAVNVIANGGVYVAPKLVKSTIDAEGEQRAAAASTSRRVVSGQTAQEMNLLMRDVVCIGTGKQSQLPGYTIAGKTGTGYKAQKNGTYFDENGHRVYYASFVGFLPAEDPQITILVSIDEPAAGGAHFGGTVASPVFTQIAQTAVRELDIAPPTADGGCPKR